MNKNYLFALSLFALPVLADNLKGFYLGVGASATDDQQDIVNTTSIRSAELIGGYKYNSWLGAEIRYGKGFKAGTSTSYLDTNLVNTLGSLEREINRYTSFYYKPELANDDAKLYALLGYTQISTRVNLPTNAKDNNSGYSYGLGIGFVITESLNINVEYKTLCDDIYNKPNTASVNFDYRF
jgi:opacity protein-like surface antigen